MERRAAAVASAAYKDIVREIKNSRNRFLAIMVLSALAVAFLCGLKVTAPDMKGTGDDYLNKQRLMDLFLGDLFSLLYLFLKIPACRSIPSSACLPVPSCSLKYSRF